MVGRREDTRDIIARRRAGRKGRGKESRGDFRAAGKN